MTLERCEVLSGELRRRHWPWALKEEIVRETLADDVTVTEVARRRGIDRSLIYRWRRQMKVSRQSRDDELLPVHLVAPAPPAEVAPADWPAERRNDDRHHADHAASTGRIEIALG